MTINLRYLYAYKLKNQRDPAKGKEQEVCFKILKAVVVFSPGNKDSSRAFVSPLYLTLCLRKLVFGLRLLLDHAVSRFLRL